MVINTLKDAEKMMNIKQNKVNIIRFIEKNTK